MKKLVSLFLSLAICVSLATAVCAKPDVSIIVDGRTITFREEAKPVILNDRTYVPIRRVLEAMGAHVTWDGENRTVGVSSKTNTKKLTLTIDSPEITVYTFTSVLDVTTDTITSDVAPIILNDRTMLPIRIVAEAIEATVKYDEETNTVEIITPHASLTAEKLYNADTSSEDFKVDVAVSEDLPKLSLACDAKDIKEGDTVTLKVKIADLEKLYDGAKISGLATTILYDSENFSFEGYSAISDDGEVSTSLSANNPKFYDNGSKLIYVMTLDTAYTPASDGTIAEVCFTALNSNGGEFSISNGISEVGYDNELIIAIDQDLTDLYKYTELFIDTTPVSVK